MEAPISKSLLLFAGAAMEASLTASDASLRAMRRALKIVSNRRFEQPKWNAPVNGPVELDSATSDFANRMLRSALLGRAAPSDFASSIMDAAAKSFSQVAPRGPEEWLTFLAELGLSFGTLATQEGLRGAVAAQSMPPERLVEFSAFVLEIFSDLEIYFTLHYQDEVQRLRQEVARNPRDAARRLQLARTLMKCGLFKEAAEELASVAGDSNVASRAAYERLVCQYKMGRFGDAVDDGLRCLAGEPKNDRAKHWLWIAAEASGGYPAQVPQELRLCVQDGWQPTSVELKDVADEIGLAKVSGGRGTAVFDFDGDGHLDVVMAGAHSGCCLYRNNGDGTFTNVSIGSGLDACVYAFAIAVGDYNNDGLPDLYISSMGFFNGGGKLMRNNGDGTFTDVTEEAGLACWGPGFTASWVDYDCDGHLDLFIANNLGGLFDRKTPNRLFHNNGDGTFTEVAQAAGLSTKWPTIGAAWGDVNNDGLPDLFLSNVGRAQLFRNNGDGTFTDVSRRAGIDLPAFGSVALWCDFDDDGWLDIIQTTYSRPLDAIHTLQYGHGPPGGVPTRLFHNNRDGTFSVVSSQLGVTGCWGTMSAAVGDFNNDGFQDILLGNGDPSMDRTEGPVLLQQDRRGQFQNVSFSAGLPHTGKGHGVVMADLAGDGRMHLIVANGGLYPGDLQTTTVHRPTTLPGNYLNVRLVGTSSNRDAIGARVTLTVAGRRQHRLVSGGSNFGCHPLEQHFGLGAAVNADSLEIRWPSGRRQTLGSCPANSFVQVVEPGL